MHLNGEVAFGIDELDEYGKLGAVFLKDGVAQQQGAIVLGQSGEVDAGQRTVFDNGFAAFHCADFPTLTHWIVIGRQVLHGFKAMAAPNDIVKIVFEQQRVKW